MVSIATLTVVIAGAAQAASPVVVGVFEEPQCKPQAPRSVRVLFAKQEARWVALAAPNPTIEHLSHDWTVAFIGKSLGRLRTRDPGWHSDYAWTYARDRLLAVAQDRLPSVANTNKLFAGWCDAPKTRPLVVVSRANVLDPAGWKVWRPGADLRQRLFAEFAAQVGHVSACPPGTDKPVELTYSAHDLVLKRGYADRSGRHLAAISLDTKLNTCDGPTATAWLENWFLIADRVVFLGPGLSLVDAGDYDKDGQSEVLFWQALYNKDGYVLFADDFKTRVEYLWSYH